RGAAPTPRARLQPRQLPAHASPAGGGRSLVADESAGEGGEDRREGDLTRPLPGLPDGGGSGAARGVRPPPRPDREAAAARPGPMLTLEGGNGGRRGSSCARRASSGAVVRPEAARRRPGPPWRASRRQKTLAWEVARAVSEPMDADGPRPSGKCRNQGHVQ